GGVAADGGSHHRILNHSRTADSTAGRVTTDDTLLRVGREEAVRVPGGDSRRITHRTESSAKYEESVCHSFWLSLGGLVCWKYFVKPTHNAFLNLNAPPRTFCVGPRSA